MKITKIRLGKISVPLRVPFKTARRSISTVDDVIVEIHTDTGNIGYGEAPPTGLVTGDTTGAIIGAIQDHIAPAITGRDIADFEDLMLTLEACIVHNTTAKAATDMALWDLFGQLYKAPLYRLLGGSRSKIVTDITISVNNPDEMVRDSRNAVQRGYDTLKIKVGKEPEKDLARLKAIREAIGYAPRIRIDANQGWKPKEAIRILHGMEDAGLEIELVEQPVVAYDVEGMKYVRDHVSIPVMADESVFSPRDALKIMQMEAADYVNIKLMKTGGIYNALKICSAAETYGVECMAGCMVEAKIAVNAAIHLTCGKGIITRVDLDGPVLCSEDPIIGGSVFNEKDITVSEDPGLGIKGIEKITYLD